MNRFTWAHVPGVQYPAAPPRAPRSTEPAEMAKAQIIKLAATTRTIDQIADEVGCSQSWVSKVLTRAKVNRDHAVTQAYSPQFRAKALALAEKIGGRDAALQLGCNRTSIYRWALEADDSSTDSKRRVA